MFGTKEEMWLQWKTLELPLDIAPKYRDLKYFLKYKIPINRSTLDSKGWGQRGT